MAEERLNRRNQEGEAVQQPNFNSHPSVELGKGDRTEDPSGRTHISAVHTHDTPVIIRHLFAAMLGLELQYPEGLIREHKSNAQRVQGFS